MTRASVLAVLLVAVPVVAHAECAWVLWAIPAGKAEGDPAAARAGFATIIAGAYESRRECQSAIDPNKVIGSKEVDAEGKPKAWIRTRQVCLPDTIDPRGPKGGMR